MCVPSGRGVSPLFWLWAPFLHFNVVVSKIVQAILILASISIFIVPLFVAYYSFWTSVPQRNAIITNAIKTVNFAIDALDVFRILYSPVSLSIPYIAEATNFVWNLFTDFFMDLRDFMCPKWPPESIEFDCPPLYKGVSLIRSLFYHIQEFIAIVSEWVENMKKELQPTICRLITSLPSYSGGPVTTQCDITFFNVLKWTLDFVIWIFTRFIQPLSDLITASYRYFVGDYSFGGIADPKQIIADLKNNTDLVIRALTLLFIDNVFSYFDLTYCYFLRYPVECLIPKICKRIFVDIEWQINFFCWYDFAAKKTRCPTVIIPLSQVCVALVPRNMGLGQCMCEAYDQCKTLLGQKVPCILGPPVSGSSCPC